MASLALLGCGRWGRNLARNLQALDVLKMIIDPACSESDLPECVSAPIYRDVSEALESQEINGVVIAAPAVRHAELVKAALLANKHVFVEKPLAMTVADAEELAALAQSRGLTLMVGHLLQYHPGFRRLSEMIRAGEIGRVRHIASNRLNPGAIRTEENALWSLAPHDFSMILSLAEAYPYKVNALAVRVVNPAIPDRYVVNMQFGDNLTATADVSWVSPYKEHRFSVLGESGAIVLDDHASDRARRLVIYRNYVDIGETAPRFLKSEGEVVPFAATEPLRAEMEAFVAEVGGRRASLTGPEEAIPVLRLLNEADRAASER